MKDDSNELTTYFTTDLWLASFLLTVGCELTKTSQTPTNPNRLIFHFRKQENIERLVANYLNGEGLAPARALFENCRALRAIAFNQNNN